MEGDALIIGNRYERRLGKSTDDVRKTRQIQPPMASGQKRYAKPAEQRQMQPIDMRVDDVEFRGFLAHGFQQYRLGNHRVSARAAETKCSGPDGMKLGSGDRIPTGKQRDLMPQAHQFINQPTPRHVRSRRKGAEPVPACSCG
jgi:hypothetical protein